jgi:hypothetical protein
MKDKSWLKYFIIIMLIILVVFCGDSIFDKKSYSQWIINPFIIAIIFYISIGLLLGLDHMILETKKIGSWRINIAKLVLLGIPSLYFSFGVFIYFGIGKYLPNVFTYPIAMLMSNAKFLSVFQIILGYSIVSSF